MSFVTVAWKSADPPEPDTERVAAAGATLTVRGDTVNGKPLLGTPPTVTTTFPVVAPIGTFKATLVPFQICAVPRVPLNVTVLVPWVGPKFVPVIVTPIPSNPDAGAMLVMTMGVTVNLAALLATPLKVTTKSPVVAPAGITTVMVVGLQLDGVRFTPLKARKPAD